MAGAMASRMVFLLSPFSFFIFPSSFNPASQS